MATPYPPTTTSAGNRRVPQRTELLHHLLVRATWDAELRKAATA